MARASLAPVREARQHSSRRQQLGRSALETASGVLTRQFVAPKYRGSARQLAKFVSRHSKDAMVAAEHKRLDVLCDELRSILDGTRVTK